MANGCGALMSFNRSPLILGGSAVRARPFSRMGARFVDSRMRIRMPALDLLLALSLLAASAPSGVAQVLDAPLDTATVVADSSDLASVGRAAQANFERRRRHYFPITLSYGSGECDEHVGRFCTWYGEGEWYPLPEKEEITALRSELLHRLDSLQHHLPGDGWLLGQRVWYRSEGGDPAGALQTAQRCGTVEPWWCAALQGFALHESGRFREAEVRFDSALESMDEERAREWRRPYRILDSDARDRLKEIPDSAADSLALALRQIWLFADPLYLVEGNDRLTAHYARWTVAHLRDRTRNPFQIRWGDDLEELTIRHGWEMGWERSPGRSFSSLDQIVGHKHPEGRDYVPSGRSLEDPAAAAESDFRADRQRPRSLHAPAYAPVLLPMEGQLALFPRREEVVIVSTHFLPADTTFHAGHDHPLPWLEAGDQEGLPDRIGLFATAAHGDTVRRTVASGRSEGALAVAVPPGDYVVSAETWSPDRRRAGRLRVGVPAATAPEDVATLSSLLLVRPLAEEPANLLSVLPSALPRARILPGQTFAIAWEVAGLGFRPETLAFEVSVERMGRNVLRRFGDFLRLTDRPQPLTLTWEEPAPDQPSEHFRYLNLDLPPLDPGEYEIRLTLRTATRSPAVTTKRFEVRERD